MSNRLKIDKVSLRVLAPAANGVRRLFADARRTLIVLTGLAVLLGSAAATLLLINTSADRLETSRTDASAAATKDVESLLSYDYRTIGSAVADRRDLVTGDFESQYADLVTKKVAPAAKAKHVVTRTQVVTSSVVSASSDEVEMLLFLNQVSSSNTSKTPLLSGSRVQVLMRKTDGTWRVAKVDPV